jgi:hypothetical protein
VRADLLFGLKWGSTSQVMTVMLVTAGEDRVKSEVLIIIAMKWL